jgi:hypothetical protein
VTQPPCSRSASGADPANLEWHRNAELVHGRWAMLGAAGCLLPELLTKVRVRSAPEHAIRGRGAFLTRLFCRLLVTGWRR